MVTRTPGARASALGWAALGLMLVAQYGLFRTFALREVVWAYPARFDQSAALRRSYETYEGIRAHGVLAGMRDRLAEQAPTGVLMPIEAAVLFLLLGPSRLSALTLSFVHLALFEAALVALLRWWSGRWSVAALGLGLLLSARFPFPVAGGLFDFRMDTIALSLWGIFICAALRSRVFADRGWSLLAGAAAGVLVLVRFLTLAYLAGVLLVMLVFMAARRRSPKNVIAAALVALVMAAPALLMNLPSMRDYYGPGHFIGFERTIWLEAQGLRTVGAHLLFYPRSLAVDQAGPFLLGMIALLVLVALLLRRTFRPEAERNAPGDGAANAVFLAAAFLAPLGVLTVHAVKSPVVGSILVPPVVIAAALLFCRLARAVRGHPLPRTTERALAVIGGLTLAAGIGYHATRLLGPGPFRGQRADIRGVLRLYDAIGDMSRARGWRAPRVSMDRMTEFLNPGLVPAVVYERRGLLLAYNGGLGSRIYAVTEPEALAQAGASDFVVVTDDGPDIGPFPFEASMRQARPALRRLCDERFERLGDYRFFGRQATLYARPENR